MTYSKMKDSGVERIGDIPKGWKVYALSQLATKVNRKNFDLREQNLLSLSYGKIKRKDIRNNEGLLPASFDGYNIIESGDIVLRLTDLQNDHTSLRVGRATEKGMITSAYVTIRPYNPHLSEMLYYALHTYDIKKGFYGMGSGVRQGLNYDEVKKVKIALPDVDTVSRIVSFLNGQCSKIDEIIDEAKASIEEYRLWKISAICQAVTKGLDPNAEIQDCEIEWIGEAPTTWQILRVKYLLTEINARSESGNEPPLSMSQVYGLVPSEMISVANPATSFVGAKIVNPDDLVFNKLKAHLGVFAVSDYYGLVSPDYAVYRANNRVLPKFLEYLFKTPRCITEFKKYISGVGAGLSRLYTSDLFNIHIALPPMREQIQIVSYLDKLCSEIGGVISEKESLISELEAYKKSLIYEAVTGKRKVG